MKENCTPENNAASGRLRADFAEQQKFEKGELGGKSIYHVDQATGICIKSDNSAISREIRIAADGRNTSAIWVRNTDVSEDGEENKCAPQD